jgi:Ca2+-binding EF-hand superfamily protein
VLLLKTNPTPHARILRASCRYDEDGNGTINVEEFQSMLMSAGMNVSQVLLKDRRLPETRANRMLSGAHRWRCKTW